MCANTNLSTPQDVVSVEDKKLSEEERKEKVGRLNSILARRGLAGIVRIKIK